MPDQEGERFSPLKKDAHTPEGIPGDPYIIRYPGIVAVTDETGSAVELIEFFDCIGGAMWSKHHYAQSPVVRSVRNCGPTMRYLLNPGRANLDLQGSRFPAGICGAAVDSEEIEISYIGIGGGGGGSSELPFLCRGCDPVPDRSCRWREEGRINDMGAEKAAGADRHR